MIFIRRACFYQSRIFQGLQISADWGKKAGLEKVKCTQFFWQVFFALFIDCFTDLFKVAQLADSTFCLLEILHHWMLWTYSYKPDLYSDAFVMHFMIDISALGILNCGYNSHLPALDHTPMLLTFDLVLFQSPSGVICSIDHYPKPEFLVQKVYVPVFSPCLSVPLFLIMNLPMLRIEIQP